MKSTSILLGLMLSLPAMAGKIQFKYGTIRPSIINQEMVVVRDIHCGLYLVNSKTEIVKQYLKVENCQSTYSIEETLVIGQNLYVTGHDWTETSRDYYLHQYQFSKDTITFIKSKKFSFPVVKGMSRDTLKPFQMNDGSIGLIINSKTTDSKLIGSHLIRYKASPFLELIDSIEIPLDNIQFAAYHQELKETWLASKLGNIYKADKNSKLSKLFTLPIENFKSDLNKAGFDPDQYWLKVQGMNILKNGIIEIDANAGIYFVDPKTLKRKDISAYSLGQLNAAKKYYGLSGGWNSTSVLTPNGQSVVIPKYKGYYIFSVTKGLEYTMEEMGVDAGYRYNDTNGIPTFLGQSRIYYIHRTPSLGYFEKIGQEWFSNENVSIDGAASWLMEINNKLWVGYTYPDTITTL